MKVDIVSRPRTGESCGRLCEDGKAPLRFLGPWSLILVQNASGTDPSRHGATDAHPQMHSRSKHVTATLMLPRPVTQRPAESQADKMLQSIPALVHCVDLSI